MSKEEMIERIGVLQQQVPELSRRSMELGFEIAIALLAQDANASIESIRAQPISSTVIERFQMKTVDEFHKKEAYLKGLQTRVIELYDAQRKEDEDGEAKEETVGTQPNED